jgi:excisionase family DNA binding protein
MQKHTTITQLAKRWGMTEKAVRHRLARGQIPFRRLGRRILIPLDEIEKFEALLAGRTAEEAVAAVEGTL